MDVDVTFCFLVTKDLVKEHIWRKWFDRLRELQLKFKVVTHISPQHKHQVQSAWLRETLIPDNYLCQTAWGYVMKAMLNLYTQAVTHSPSDWYTLHSESCVPLVTPERFIETFQANKTKTFLSHCKAWWTPTPSQNDRANLHLLPREYHLANQHWSIFCHADLIEMIILSQRYENLTNILLDGHASEESFQAIYLSNINNFQNVLNKMTTLVDWKRSPNGNNPYTFQSWTEADKLAVAELRQAEPTLLFLRKVDATFPDEVLNEFLM